MFSHSTRESDARGHRSVLGEDILQPTAEGPGRDGQEDELAAPLLAPLCSSVGRRFRKLVHIDKQSPDITGGPHVGKDDLDVGAGDEGMSFGFAGDETGKTKVRSLMIALDAGRKTAVHYELKLDTVVTTIRTSGFGVETVEYKNLSFTMWGVGGQDKMPGYKWSDLRCQQQRSTQGRGCKRRAQQNDRGGNARFGCARFCQHTHAFHGNSLG